MDTEPGRGSAEADAHCTEAEGDFLALQSSTPRCLPLSEAGEANGGGEFDSDLSEPDPPGLQLACQGRVQAMGASCGIWISSIPKGAALRPAPSKKRTRALQQDGSQSKRPRGDPTHGAAQALEEGELRERRVRKRGRGSRRPRAGQAVQEQRRCGPMGVRQDEPAPRPHLS